MGNSNTRNYKKHLVIVGGSMAGINLLHYVQNDFKITLIEKREYFEWI